MKEKINLSDYAALIQDELAKGILLNTNGDKFNSMGIAWGAIGRIWNLPTFTVYVREHRYTKSQLDKTGEFTISIPLEKPDPNIMKVCGSLSGRDIDKVKEANLTLEEPSVNHTPGIKEYPLTIECKVLHAQRQDVSQLPEDIQRRMYPQEIESSHPGSNKDVHTTYIGEILDAYIIR